MSKTKFVLDNGTEMTKTETIHYLLQQNKELRERLDRLEGTSDTISFSSTDYGVASNHVPFSVTGNDIVTFDSLDFAKVNDSWLD